MNVECVKTRVTQENFEGVAGRWVTIQSSLDVPLEGSEHARL